MKYTRVILNSYSLLNLRTIARDMGVKSPTTKKYSELIDSIIDIQEGKLQPDNSIKRGRKPKGRITYDEDRYKEEFKTQLVEQLSGLNDEYFNKMNESINEINNEYKNKINESIDKIKTEHAKKIDDLFKSYLTKI